MDSDISNQTGLIGNKLGSFTENEPVDITPESSVMDTTDWFGRLKTGARALGMANATLGTVDDYGRETTAPLPDDDAKSLNDRYPPAPGEAPLFDKPLPDVVASGIYEHHQEEAAIAEAKSRRPDGFWSTAATYGTQFAADMLDPLNIASMFVPVVGEGKFVAEGAGLVGRIAGRAAAGAVNADIGQIPLIAMQYGQSKLENDDYGAVQAMGDIATGAAMGAVFHTAISGPLGDYLARRVARSPIQTALEADPALRQSALRTAISQAATDTDVEVRPVFSAAGLRAATEARDNLLNDAAAVENIVPGSPAALRINDIDEELGGSQRLAAIDAELGGVIPASRRAELETEKTLVTQGEQLPSLEHLKALHEERDHIIALEGARAEAQRSGLMDAATRSEAQITDHLQAKHAEDYATLEQMAKDSGTDIHTAYQAIATSADAPLEDMERAYQQIRASEAASRSARGGEQPGVPGPNAGAGAEGAGQVVGAPQPGAAGGAAGPAEVAGPAGGASPAAVSGAGAARGADWIAANRSEAVSLAQRLGLTDKIKELATAGKTAKEISSSIGGRLDANEVRAVRDSLGIEASGPSGLAFGPAIPEERGPITPSQIQRRDGVGYNEAVRRAQSENANLALRQQTEATAAQRAADGIPSPAAQAVTREAQAATKVPATELLKAASQDIEDHTAFFKAAEAVGALTDADRSALQSLGAVDENAKSLTNAAMQAAACIARGLG